MTGKQLLLVEDDRKTQAYNKELFEGYGFNVSTALTLAKAKDVIKRKTPDAIVLDVGMPDGCGLAYLREFRQKSKIPVLLLTGSGNDSDIIDGFECGCNDCLPKPYNFDVLLARLKNLLRTAEQLPETISVGALKLNLFSGRAFLNDDDLNLTEKEFAIIRLLTQSAGKMIDTEIVYEKVWGQPMAGDKNALQVAITRLRKKITPAGYDIISVRGKGYVFEVKR